MGYGGTVGIVSPRRISLAGGTIAWANWCRSTARSTPGSRTGGAAAHAADFCRRCDEPVDGAAVRHLGSGEAQCVSLTDSLPTDSPAIAEN